MLAGTPFKQKHSTALWARLKWGPVTYYKYLNAGWKPCPSLRWTSQRMGTCLDVHSQLHDRCSSVCLQEGDEKKDKGFLGEASLIKPRYEIIDKVPRLQCESKALNVTTVHSRTGKCDLYGLISAMALTCSWVWTQSHAKVPDMVPASLSLCRSFWHL